MLGSPQPPDDDEASRTIVELGAGDYSNAIAMKAANPTATVYATNLKSEWLTGQRFNDAGFSADEFSQVALYLGFLPAKAAGVIVGDAAPLENSDIDPGIGDLVYTILPYPGRPKGPAVDTPDYPSYQFGRQAARIAKTKPGTIVAVTEGGSGSSDRFVQGFQSLRPGSQFVTIPGSPYGKTTEKWGEKGPFITKIYTQL